MHFDYTEVILEKSVQNIKVRQVSGNLCPGQLEDSCHFHQLSSKRILWDTLYVKYICRSFASLPLFTQNRAVVRMPQKRLQQRQRKTQKGPYNGAWILVRQKTKQSVRLKHIDVQSQLTFALQICPQKGFNFSHVWCHNSEINVRLHKINSDYSINYSWDRFSALLKKRYLKQKNIKLFHFFNDHILLQIIIDTYIL